MQRLRSVDERCHSSLYTQISTTPTKYRWLNPFAILLILCNRYIRQCFERFINRCQYFIAFTMREGKGFVNVEISIYIERIKRLLPLSCDWAPAVSIEVSVQSMIINSFRAIFSKLIAMLIERWLCWCVCVVALSHYVLVDASEMSSFIDQSQFYDEVCRSMCQWFHFLFINVAFSQHFTVWRMSYCRLALCRSAFGLDVPRSLHFSTFANKFNRHIWLISYLVYQYEIKLAIVSDSCSLFMSM